MPAESRRVSSGSAEQGGAVVEVGEDYDAAIEALKAKKPLLVYYFVEGVVDPMNDNYTFSRKFEMGVLGISKVVDFLNKEFVCRKIALPAEADMKVAKNQARIEIYGATNTLIGTIGRDADGLLNSAPFTAFAKVRIAKSDSLAKKEIARLEKEKAEAARREKDAPAAETEVADAR